jgi:gamma-glutamyltranspeptidase
VFEESQAAAVADVEQADYYRGFFEGERAELARELAKHVKNLTGCMTRSDMREVSVIRRAIRNAEWEMRAIDRMIEALDQRFPGRSAQGASVDS